MTATLEILALGELEVRYDGQALALPQSRKTRALLAYLALTGRPHRRERLCTLFWDVADDTRAALRWSLSKLRPVLDVGNVERLVATRAHVELPPASTTLDLSLARAALLEGLEGLSTERLAALAAVFRGDLLEGLFLPDFDEFEAWLEAERAQARGLRVQVLRALTTRLAAQPDAALPYARTWLEITGGASPEAKACVDGLALRLGETRLGPAGKPSAAATTNSPPRPALPATQASPSPLVRPAQLGRLQALAKDVRRGAGPRLVLLTGGPGLGKTRLVQELVRLEDGQAYILRGGCHEAERSRPFGPFVDVLRRLGDREAWAEDLAELATLRAPGNTGTVDTESLLVAFASLVRRAGAQFGLCLLIVDDAHLADERSAELLHYVLRADANAPLLAIAACRAPDLIDNAPLQTCLRGLGRLGLIEELPLGPLGIEEVQDLVRIAAPGAPARAIAERSAGNPLFALELARSRDDRIPPNLSEAILDRLATLDPRTQALIRWAAVFDRSPVSQLEAVAKGDVPDLVLAAEEAERYGFIRVASDTPGARVEMAHDLIRDVVEGSLSAVRRAAMHRKVAAYLGGLPARAELAPIIAHHAVKADNPGLAVRACREAAERSAAWKGKREAKDLVDLGLQHAALLPAPERQERQIELLQILLRVERPERIDELVEKLLKLGTEALALGCGTAGQMAFHLVGYLRWDHDDPWRAQEGVLQAMQASKASPADRALGLATSAMCLALLEQDLSRAAALLVEAELHARELSQPPVELSVARGLLHRHRGEVAAAREAFIEARTRALAVGDRPSEARSIEHQMLLELEAGQAEAVRSLAHALRELGPHIREGGEGPLAAGVLTLLDGGPDQMQEAVTPFLAQLERLDDKRRLGIVLRALAQCELESGALDPARRHAERTLELARRMNRPSDAAIAAALLMRIAALQDDDRLYARAEGRLTELETKAVLSAEARAHIQRATAPAPTTEGDAAWRS